MWQIPTCPLPTVGVAVGAAVPEVGVAVPGVAVPVAGVADPGVAVDASGIVTVWPEAVLGAVKMTRRAAVANEALKNVVMVASSGSDGLKRHL
jgi:hypothetical protein